MKKEYSDIIIVFNSFVNEAYSVLNVPCVPLICRSRLLDEAIIHGRLDHENIVKMLGLIFEPGSLRLDLGVHAER